MIENFYVLSPDGSDQIIHRDEAHQDLHSPDFLPIPLDTHTQRERLILHAQDVFVFGNDEFLDYAVDQNYDRQRLPPLQVQVTNSSEAAPLSIELVPNNRLSDGYQLLRVRRSN